MKPLAPLAALALAGCATARSPSDPQDTFFARLRALCGKAYEGRVVSSDAADTEMRSQRLVMHVRDCSTDSVRIPFHVGENRSRTWVVARTAQGLRLKHDHRHKDGSEDRLTQYGGDTAGEGTVDRQEFPADEHSKRMFTEQNLPQSIPNVWAIEANAATLAYELRRPGRFFRVEFDLARPVAAPPPPWGAE